MNRGSDGRIVAEDAALIRFNEAPIHESGKFLFHRVADFGSYRLQ